jgi:hypothetical protein
MWNTMSSPPRYIIVIVIQGIKQSLTIISQCQGIFVYEENKKLHTVLGISDNFLQVQQPQTNTAFDEMADDPDMEFGGSRQSSIKTSDATAHTGNSQMPLYKLAYAYLSKGMLAENEWKPAAQRKVQREGESLHTCTSMALGNTKEGLVTGENVILKIKGDRNKFQNSTTFYEVNANISKSDTNQRAILQLSEVNSHKLLLLASVLGNMDTTKKMPDSILQKCLFNGTKQLKLKEFIGDYEVYPLTNPNGAPNKALFCLLLTYVDMHFKMIIQRKDTNGFGDKAFLALQAQCASIMSVEQNNTQRSFTRMRIVSQKSLSSYLHHFSMAQDKAETVGNEYTNDALVDLFLSSLGTDTMAWKGTCR